MWPNLFLMFWVSFCFQALRWRKNLYQGFLAAFMIVIAGEVIRHAGASLDLARYAVFSQVLLSCFVHSALRLVQAIKSEKFFFTDRLPISLVFHDFIQLSVGFFWRFPLYYATGFAYLSLFWKMPDFSLLSFFGFYLMGYVASILFFLIGCLIGLAGFWLQNARALYFLNFSLLLALGGVLVPLRYAHPSLQTISSYTPFIWILSEVIEVNVLGHGVFYIKFLRQLFVLLLILFFYRLLLKKLWNAFDLGGN